MIIGYSYHFDYLTLQVSAFMTKKNNLFLSLFYFTFLLKILFLPRHQFLEIIKLYFILSYRILWFTYYNSAYPYLLGIFT